MQVDARLGVHYECCCSVQEESCCALVGHERANCSLFCMLRSAGLGSRLGIACPPTGKLKEMMMKQTQIVTCTQTSLQARVPLRCVLAVMQAARRGTAVVPCSVPIQEVKSRQPEAQAVDAGLGHPALTRVNRHLHSVCLAGIVLQMSLVQLRGAVLS